MYVRRPEPCNDPKVTKKVVAVVVCARGDGPASSAFVSGVAVRCGFGCSVVFSGVAEPERAGTGFRYFFSKPGRAPLLF